MDSLANNSKRLPRGVSRYFQNYQRSSDKTLVFSSGVT